MLSPDWVIMPICPIVLMVLSVPRKNEIPGFYFSKFDFRFLLHR